MPLHTQYNIWRLSYPKSWVDSGIEASSPQAALEKVLERERNRFSGSNLYAEGGTFLVASTTGGHGKAGVFTLKPESEPKLVAEAVTF